MTDVGFDRTEIELVAPLWSSKDLTNAFTLDWIANRGVGAVGFYERNLVGIYAGNWRSPSIKIALRLSVRNCY